MLGCFKDYHSVKTSFSKRDCESEYFFEMQTNNAKVHDRYTLRTSTVSMPTKNLYFDNNSNWLDICQTDFSRRSGLSFFNTFLLTLTTSIFNIKRKAASKELKQKHYERSLFISVKKGQTKSPALSKAIILARLWVSQDLVLLYIYPLPHRIFWDAMNGLFCGRI